MIIAWVLGGRGLLGSALCRALSRDDTSLFTPPERFCWDQGQKLSSQIAEAVQAFSSRAASAERWEIYWAAGIGTLSSPPEALAPETNAFSNLLRLIESDRRLSGMPGSVTLASSAGAIYAGSPDEIITEKTPPTPASPYAHEKLRQEELLNSFAMAHQGISAFIARISTLYGSGQSTGKPQGLLTQIARSMVRHKSIEIYVPYDTIRDYIAADDAAAAIIETLRSTRTRPHVLIKIIASEKPTTIAEVVSIFKRLTRTAPRIVTSTSRLSGYYSRRVQFRSTVFPEKPLTPRRSLYVGVAELMAAERIAFARNTEDRK